MTAIVIKRKKNTPTSDELYRDVLQQLENDRLNIEGVRDFVDNWRDCFAHQKELEPYIGNMELRILEALQSYWGRGSFVDVDRENMTITCFGSDGRKVTI